MVNSVIVRIIILGYLLAVMGTRVYFFRVLFQARTPTFTRQGLREFIRTQGWRFVTFSTLVGTLLGLALILYFLNLPLFTWTHLPLPEWIPGMGIILGIAVFPFHVWVHKTLGNAMEPANDGTLIHQLVTDGPYRYIRHPMFVTTAIVLIAIALMTVDLLMFLGVAGMIILMIVWAPREEQRLIDQFGERYRVYMQRTGRFLPKRQKSD